METRGLVLREFNVSVGWIVRIGTPARRIVSPELIAEQRIEPAGERWTEVQWYGEQPVASGGKSGVLGQARDFGADHRGHGAVDRVTQCTAQGPDLDPEFDPARPHQCVRDRCRDLSGNPGRG